MLAYKAPVCQKTSETLCICIGHWNRIRCSVACIRVLVDLLQNSGSIHYSSVGLLLQCQIKRLRYFWWFFLGPIIRCNWTRINISVDNELQAVN